MPKEKLEQIQVEDELFGFVTQSHISEKNRKRLAVLMEHPNLTIREAAALLIQVSAIAPHRRKRWNKVREADRELHAECMEMGWTNHPY